MFLSSDFLFYQSVVAGVFLSLAAGLYEGPILMKSWNDLDFETISFILLVSGLMSILYQSSLIGLVNATTPLDKEIISQTKVIPQTLLAIMIFDEQYTSLTIIGLGLTVMGMGSYSYFAWNESSLEQTVELEEFKDESDEVLSVQSHHRQA